MEQREILNSGIHGIGALVSAIGLIILLLHASNEWMLAGFLVYGITLILLFLSSTLYHGFSFSRVEEWLRIMDHNSIYLLIAGTYTPITLISLRGPWGWSLFGTIWGLALLGILASSFFGKSYPRVETITYILMGWLSLIALSKIIATMGLIGFSLLGAGGLIYTLGVIFYKWEDLPYNHAIWHFFVLMAATCHYCVIYLYVAP